MGGDEKSSNGDASAAANNGRGAEGGITGVIVPPPEVRAIVDKTAGFVARNGKAFEARILEKNASSARFGFLKITNPYNRYYLKKIDEIALKLVNDEEKGEEGEEKEKAEEKADAQAETKTEADVDEEVSKSAVRLTTTRSVSLDARKPPPDFYFETEHPEDSISALQGEIIKITAAYTAVRGKSFVSEIVRREQKNPYFRFLRPQSDLFSFYTSIVDSYQKILDPKHPCAAFPDQVLGDSAKLLDRCLHRLEYKRMEEKEKSGAEAAVSNGGRIETVSSDIDWHDFVVVETIDFDDKKKENADESTTRRVEGNGEPEFEVRSDYVPNVEAAAQSVSMITLPDGRVIPSDQVNEHMRIEHMDPRYMEQQKRFLEKRRETNLQERSMANNLARLAKTRPDVFGGEEKVEEGAIDGDAAASSEEVPLIPPAVPISHQYHAPGTGAPGILPWIAPAAAPQTAAVQSYQSRSSMTLTINVPLGGGQDEWNLKGQTISLSLPGSTSTIGDAKIAAQAQLGGKIPLNKFQLHHPIAGFLKDKRNFADSKVASGDTLTLKLRKK